MPDSKPNSTGLQLPETRLAQMQYEIALIKYNNAAQEVAAFEDLLRIPRKDSKLLKRRAQALQK